MRAVKMSRGTRNVLAALLGLGWLAYMVVGLQVVNAIAPTQHGSGPAGLAGFVGLVSGVFVAGFIMWAAASD
jgi:hypothetical protein